MKRLLVIGMIVMLVFSIGTGVAHAQSNSNQWGYKLDINLQKEAQPYLKVLTDMLVAHYNEMNSSYRINSYDTELNGTVEMAGAFKENGNNVIFNSGDLTSANLSFYFNGTFPFANNVSEYMKKIEPKNMNISGLTSIFHTDISNGTVETDGSGNISKITSSSDTYLKVHVRGKNLPIPLLLYSMLLANVTQFHSLEIRVGSLSTPTISNVTSTSMALSFPIYMDEKIDNESVNIIEISNISAEDKNLTIKVDDKNNNGMLDTGDVITIEGSTLYFHHLMANFKDITLQITFAYGDQIFYMHPRLYYMQTWEENGEWHMGTIGWYSDIPYIIPKYEKLVENCSNMAPYDNFDFTVELEYNESTVTSFSSPFHLIPEKGYNSTVNVQGSYSGIVKIIGLQEKYLKIIEVLTNNTFKMNGDVAEYTFHGNISKSSEFKAPPIKMAGEMQYGGESVYIVEFINTNETWNPSPPKFKFDFYYFYSPSKHFIVGGGVNLGVKKFDTQPTSYENAMNEIKSMKKQEESNENAPKNENWSWILWVSVGLILLVIVIAIAAIVHRGKRE